MDKRREGRPGDARAALRRSVRENGLVPVLESCIHSLPHTNPGLKNARWRILNKNITVCFCFPRDVRCLLVLIYSYSFILAVDLM